MKYHSDILWILGEINNPKTISFSESELDKIESIKNTVFIFEKSTNKITNHSVSDDIISDVLVRLESLFQEENKILAQAYQGVDYFLLSFSNIYNIALSDNLSDVDLSKAIDNFCEHALYRNGFKGHMIGESFKNFRKNSISREAFNRDTIPSIEDEVESEYRSALIQSVIDKISAKSYLEVGVHSFSTFSQIVCDLKVAVDPLPRYTSFVKRDNERVIEITSDEFFSKNGDKFDVIFLDGFHEANQLKRDIDSSLDILNDEGIIFCHDCNPAGYFHQAFPPNRNGDCWRAFVGIVSKRGDLDAFVINRDQGMGVIRKNNKNQDNIEYTISDISFKDFEENKRELLNLISKEEFNMWVDNL